MDRRWRQKSAAEIEAVSRVADCLFDLERREVLSDAQIVCLARAIDAIELGAFETATSLADEALGPAQAQAGDPPQPERAHALVQSLAFKQLRGRFLRLAAGIEPIARRL